MSLSLSKTPHSLIEHTSTNNNVGLATKAIHAAYDASNEHGALNPPLHMSSTFTFENVQAGGDMFAGEKEGHFYSRISNPTLQILEERMAILESSEAALATASGIAAITSACWTLLKAGDEIIADKTLYGCTYSFFEHALQKFGVGIKYVDLTDLDALEECITASTTIIYFETPSNPNMRLVDIKSICSIAKKKAITTIVDNTYGTPLITRPVELGADLVIHSATKYLGGHGDLIGGLVCGAKTLIDRIRLEGLKDMTGACMSPFTAMLIMRGLKTLELRMQRHSENALKVASFLAQHDLVERVDYPGLKTHPQYSLACQQMALFGGMIAFELNASANESELFMNSLQLIQRAVSLGDAESLIQHPASMTHSVYTPEQREAHGISDSLIRLSVGLECIEDILSDLAQAFEQLNRPKLSSA
ncbi:methionine gamma-lyase [Ningiella sp. W23]|uniref:methionine gamma-lyase n=1 Tax=Ningiella sp. W23 TaxID=3023715 RepID=UPI00375758D1